MKLTGAKIMIRCLEKEGVDYIFGLPGGAILPTFDALYDSKKLKIVNPIPAGEISIPVFVRIARNNPSAKAPEK